MSRRRFAIDALPGDTPVTLPAAASHHLLRVLRLGVGAEVTVFDGSGMQVLARVCDVVDDRARLEAIAPPAAAAPAHPAHVVLALVKPKALDVALRMAVEAGVTHIHVYASTRSLRRPPRLDRWSRVTVAAAQQCGRADVPVLDWADSLQACLDALPPGLELAVAVPGAPAAPSPRGAAAVVVGPEGGLTSAEVGIARAAGATPLGLGAWTLRADTAAALAAAWVSAD